MNSKSTAQSFQYYPLSVGDYWEYIDPMYQEILTIKIIKDTIMSNGKSYSQFEGSRIRYQRFDKGCVYFYDSKFEQEYLLFDFYATPNTLISTFVRGVDTTDVYYKGVHRDSLKYLGTQDSLWRFYVDWNRQYLDEEAIYLFADSVGLVWMYGFMWGDDLPPKNLTI